MRSYTALLSALLFGIACGGTTDPSGVTADSVGGGPSGAGASSGGRSSAGAGGSAVGKAGSASGGSASQAGGAPVCECPGHVCGPPLQLLIAPQGDPAALIANLEVSAPSLPPLTCLASGGGTCQWTCELPYGASPIPNGDHTITVSAPGYQTATVQIHAVTPTNCGCCGCCPFSASEQVELVPTGQPVEGCCAALQTDSLNCGECGHACPNRGACSDGQCIFGLSGCLQLNEPAQNCIEYCAGVGQVCDASCGENGARGMQTWSAGSNCSNSTGTPSYGACSDVFPFRPNGATSFRCCCGDP